MDLIINGVTLSGDLMDADFMEKFETGMKKMRDDALATKGVQYESTAAHIRAQCKVVDTCFDDIFGPGTAAAVFQGKMNVRDHLLALGQIIDWEAAEKKATNDMTNKYTQRQQNAVRNMQTAQFVSQKHGKGKGKRH